MHYLLAMCTWRFHTESERCIMNCVDMLGWLQKAPHCQWASKHLKSKTADQAVWGRHVFDLHICIEVNVLQGIHSRKSLEALAMAARVSLSCRATIRILNPPCPRPSPLPPATLDAEHLCGVTQQEPEPHTTPRMAPVIWSRLKHYPWHVTGRDRELAGVSMPQASCEVFKQMGRV